MKKIFIIVLIFLVMDFVYSDDNDPDKKGGILELSANVGFGFLFSGFQRELGDTSLTPEPDNYLTLGAGVDFSVFPLNFLGVNGGYKFNVTNANSRDVSQFLAMYKINSIYAGVIFRWFLPTRSKVAIEIAGGVNYSFIKYHDDYTDLFGGSENFYDIKPGRGAYGKIGFLGYLKDLFFMGLNIHYSFKNSEIETSITQLEGHYIIIELCGGVSLF
jgi:hypothetical protein